VLPGLALSFTGKASAFRAVGAFVYEVVEP